MTEPQEGFIVVRKVSAHFPVSAEVYAVTLNPEPPPPDPAFEARKATAALVIPASIRRLDALEDPVSRAVLDLHRRTTSGYSRTPWWECAVCHDGGDMGDRLQWPCPTVEAVAAVHGIDLTDDWVFRRPPDGSLDLPEVAE